MKHKGFTAAVARLVQVNSSTLCASEAHKCHSGVNWMAFLAVVVTLLCAGALIRGNARTIHMEDLSVTSEHMDELAAAGDHMDELAAAGDHMDELAVAGDHMDELAVAGDHMDELAVAGDHMGNEFGVHNLRSEHMEMLG